MYESFPNSGGEQWSQFEEPNRNRQDNIDESSEHLETTPIQDLGRRALKSMNSEVITSENPVDAGEEEILTENIEIIPQFDTAESLAERQEKLKKRYKNRYWRPTTLW